MTILQCLHIWGLACGYGNKFEAFRSWKLVFFGMAESGQVLYYPENKMVGEKTKAKISLETVKSSLEG